MLLAIVVGVSLGVLSARHPGGWIDRGALALAYAGVSFPVYWVGLLLILLFAVVLHWLPPSGYGRPEFLILPALALGLALDSLSRAHDALVHARMCSRARISCARHARRDAREKVVANASRAAERARTRD